jgi:hypothetical protein
MLLVYLDTTVNFIINLNFILFHLFGIKRRIFFKKFQTKKSKIYSFLFKTKTFHSIFILFFCETLGFQNVSRTKLKLLILQTTLLPLLDYSEYRVFQCRKK